ncbi:hypothetical protein KIH07_11620 [Hydrogenophaga taeniospiralis]|uniref:hypothetical protein n=1 Tax=Hydrogenophaga taeniospiralis TaxID=65656 RepID=UPI001CF9ECA1|nr:hypothetical protein [Hydrogenophaga taeniospiralis]MCB4364387.1 hypothetical protein [Hydrogenophaga taeniospiralis]
MKSGASKPAQLIAISIMMVTSSVAVGQNLQCPDIAKTLKEYSIDSSSSSYLNAVFSQHCQQDGSRKSDGGGIGLEAVVKAIPIKFTGSYSNSEEAVSNFCKTYASQTAATAASDSYKETISLKALETIQQCNALQGSGVTIIHQVNNVEAANFYLRRSVIQPLELQGVAATGNVTCEGLVGGKKKVFDSSISVSVKTTQSFACKRVGQRQAAGSPLFFSESIITVLTNQGNYSLFWPRDERQSENMATQIDRRITLAEGELAVTKANVVPLVKASSLAIYKCPSGAAVSYNAAWMYLGCNGQLSAESTCSNVWYNKPVEVRQCAPAGNLRLFQ